MEEAIFMHIGKSIGDLVDHVSRVGYRCTWFIFMWISFLLLSSWNKPHRCCSQGIRRPCKAIRKRGGPILVLLCWSGWVFWGILSLAVRCIRSSLCISASFSWWQLLSPFWYWWPYRLFRRHHLPVFLSSCIFTSINTIIYQYKTLFKVIKLIANIHFSSF